VTESVERQKVAECNQQVGSAVCTSRRIDRTSLKMQDIIFCPKQPASCSSLTLVQE
jgi:hypothetical protein